MQADTLRAIANAVRAGEVPAAHPGTFKAFSDNAVALNPSLDEGSLARVLAALTADDLPMLERAAQACEDGERAWLAFKVVSDPEVAVDSEDTDVVGIRGKGEGSADGENRIFLVIDPADNRDTAEIVAGHEYSRRDRFQILDVTRGPRMHNDQYAGLTWVCEPLFKESRVVILGASAVGLELAQVARRVGFSTMVLDDDAEFLAEELLPDSSRILVDWESLPDWQLGELDYVCVLTRGHMHDPEAIAWGIKQGAGYVGMMGHPTKNARVFDIAEERYGVTREQLEATHTPIGIRFGAKTAPELSISILAELIQVRHEMSKRGVPFTHES